MKNKIEMNDKNRVVHINCDLTWLYSQTPDGNWISICLPLRLVVQAPTPAKMREYSSEAMDETFKEMLATNEFESFLEQHGWSSTTDSGAPLGPTEHIDFDIPFKVKRSDSNALACAVG